MWEEYYNKCVETKSNPEFIKFITDLEKTESVEDLLTFFNTRKIPTIPSPEDVNVLTNIDCVKKLLNYEYGLCFKYNIIKKEIVHFLLQRKWLPNVDEFYCLIFFLSLKNFKTALVLAKQRENYNIDIYYCLCCAVRCNKFKIFKFIFENNNINKRKYRDLFRCIVENRREDMFFYLIESGIKVPNFPTIFLSCMQNFSMKIFMYFLDNDYDIHKGKNAILRAALLKENIEAVKLLLERGAYVHTNNEEFLRIAVSFANVELIKLFIDYGAKPIVLSSSDIEENITLEICQILYDNGLQLKVLKKLNFIEQVSHFLLTLNEE